MCVDTVRVSVRDIGSKVWVHLPNETGTNFAGGTVRLALLEDFV